MRNFEPRGAERTEASPQQARDFSEAGYAAEYERLEAKLFGGMSSIVEVPFTHRPVDSGRGGGHVSAVSSAEAAAAGQREAEKRGDIVAVSGKSLP